MRAMGSHPKRQFAEMRYELSAIQNWPLQIESPPKPKYHLGAGRAAYAVGWGG